MDKRVLIVDDDPATVRLLSKHLTDGGHTVLTASNGREAMRVLLSEAPPIVITDWAMPEMSGLELCRAIRKHEGLGFVYVIVLTAQPQDDHIVEAFEAGADDYLSKPVNFKALLARMWAGQRIVQLQEDLEKRNRQVQRFNAQMEIANSELAVANEKLHILATEDELTGLTNRREAMARLADIWALSVRQEVPCSCVLLDIDHFKKVNDTYGHDVGDLVLKEVAGALNRSARRGEMVARIGGEEFLVLCPGSDMEAAACAAERLRRVIEELRIERDDLRIEVTISLGVAHRSASVKDSESLLKTADQALYEAKRSGRNRVCRAREEGSACSKEAWTRPADGDELPASAEPGGVARPPAPPRQRRDASEPAKILVVSEDGHTQGVYRKRLDQEAYVVTEAANGVDALVLAESQRPDVILLDVALRGMDAPTCTRRLKTNLGLRDIPIILIGRQLSPGVVEQAFRAGAEDHLARPLPPRELALRLRIMVRLHQSRQEVLLSNQARGEQARAMGILLDFSHDLATGEDLRWVLEKVVSVTTELTCSRRISVMLPSPDNQYLSVVHSSGIEEGAFAGTRFPVATGLAGQVYSTGGLVLADAEDQARRCLEEEAYLFAGDLLVSAAMVVSGHAVGVLNVSDRRGGLPYTALDLEYIDLIRGIAAPAVRNLLNRQARDEARDSVVIALAKLAEHRDTDTGKHLDRVTRFSLLLAEHLRVRTPFRDAIDAEFLHDLERAVPLHDIGKVAIPDHILLKPGKLTPEEVVVMQAHAEVGAKTLRSLAERCPGVSFLKMAEEIAHFHHERYEGSGYPRGLQGEVIPLAARIAALADVYDAITTKRVYKEAMSHEEAADIICSQAGKQFDPAVVDAFQHREAEFAALAVELADEPADGRADEKSLRRQMVPEEHAETSPIPVG